GAEGAPSGSSMRRASQPRRRSRGCVTAATGVAPRRRPTTSSSGRAPITQTTTSASRSGDGPAGRPASRRPKSAPDAPAGASVGSRGAPRSPTGCPFVDRLPAGRATGWTGGPRGACPRRWPLPQGELAHDGAVALSLAPRPVVDADEARGRRGVGLARLDAAEALRDAGGQAR